MRFHSRTICKTWNDAGHKSSRRVVYAVCVVRNTFCRGLVRESFGIIAALMLAIGTIRASELSDPNQLLELGAQRVRDNTAALKRLTCEEHTAREFYLPFKESDRGIARKPAVQGDLPLPALLNAPLQGRKMLWSDHLHVELSLFGGRDMFSWPGGGSFDSASLSALVNFGATLSGVLGAFDVNVLLDEKDRKLSRFQRSFADFGTTVAEYSYSVPAERSDLIVPGSNDSHAGIPYEGLFFLDTATGDLRRLAVQISKFPASARIAQGAISTDYGPRVIAEASAFVPVMSTMRLLFDNGQLAINVMQYSNCHEFQAESTLHFTDLSDGSEHHENQSLSQELPPLPKSRLLKLALDTPIDSANTAAGDLIHAHVTKALRGKDGRVVLPEGTVAEGRVLRLVTYAYPYDAVELIVKFSALKVGVETMTVRLSPPEGEKPAAENLNEIYRVGREQQRVTPIYVPEDKDRLAAAEADRKNGTGTFEFNHTNHIHLSAGYVTEWVVN